MVQTYKASQTVPKDSKALTGNTKAEPLELQASLPTFHNNYTLWFPERS